MGFIDCRSYNVNLLNKLAYTATPLLRALRLRQLHIYRNLSIYEEYNYLANVSPLICHTHCYYPCYGITFFLLHHHHLSVTSQMSLTCLYDSSASIACAFEDRALDNSKAAKVATSIGSLGSTLHIEAITDSKLEENRASPRDGHLVADLRRRRREMIDVPTVRIE